MDSTTRIRQDILAKGEGLERGNVMYDTDPIEGIQDAWELKQTQITRVRLPTMDLPPISPYIEHRYVQKELNTTDDRLKKKRRDMVVRNNNLRKQWFELAEKEKALKENFISFSKFLKTNMEKRERAVKKLQTDTENLQHRTLETDQLRRKYNILRQQFLMMRGEIEKHSIYQSFLEGVIESSGGEFKDIEDLPKRMELLMIASEKLQKHQGDLLGRLECSKRVMSQFMERNIHQILGLNNTIACLQYAFDDAVARTIELDNMVVNLKTTILKAATDVFANTDGIKNLYRQMCIKQRVTEKHRKKDAVGQLMEINHAITGYEKVFDLMQRKSKRESRISRRLQ